VIHSDAQHILDEHLSGKHHHGTQALPHAQCYHSHCTLNLVNSDVANFGISQKANAKQRIDENAQKKPKPDHPKVYIA